MNYEKLLELAREQANKEACEFWPASQPESREDQRRYLVVKYYLEYISPIPVIEAL